MMQTTAKKQSTKPRDCPKELMVEGIVKTRKKPETFSKEEISGIIQRRQELILEGMNDTEISKIIEKQTGRLSECIRGKFRQLIKQKLLDPNPNKRDDRPSKEELEKIFRLWEKLISKGQCEERNIRKISQEIGRSYRSIERIIRWRLKKNMLSAPQNKRVIRRFTAIELELLERRRNELILNDFDDKAVSKEIACELGRAASSIYAKIERLVTKGLLPRNPNKVERFGDIEIDTIKTLRSQFIDECLNDTRISRIVAKRIERSAGAIRAKITELVKKGILDKNPNNIRGFCDEESKDIIKRRNELIILGFKDNQLSRMIAKELQRPAHSISTKIKRLIEQGLIGENPNKGLPSISHRKNSDSQLLKLANEYMSINGIRTKAEFSKSNSRLYRALYRRGLLNMLKFEQTQRDCRDWASKSNMELLEYSKKIMIELGIDGKDELKKKDPGLYEILRIRNLISKVDFEEKNRNWSSLSNDQLIHYAREYMKEKRITGRRKLEIADKALYEVLRRRSLISLVFSGIEQVKNNTIESELSSGLRQAAEAMEQFGSDS